MTPQEQPAQSQGNKAQHSPLPWQVGDRSRYHTYVLSGGLEVCELLKPDRDERIADAALIVDSVNYCEALEATIDGKRVSMKEYTSDRLHAALLWQERTQAHADKLAEELRQVLKHGSAGNENHIRQALAAYESEAAQ